MTLAEQESSAPLTSPGTRQSMEGSQQRWWRRRPRLWDVACIPGGHKRDALTDRSGVEQLEAVVERLSVHGLFVRSSSWGGPSSQWVFFGFGLYAYVW